jgi:hypothetical protein
MCPEYGVTYLSGRTKEFADSVSGKSAWRMQSEKSDRSCEFAPNSRISHSANFLSDSEPRVLAAPAWGIAAIENLGQRGPPPAERLVCRADCFTIADARRPAT